MRPSSIFNISHIITNLSCIDKQVKKQPSNKINLTHRIKPIVDQMFQILAHSDLPHELVLVPVHARQLSHVSKDVLKTVSQLE